MEEICDKMPKVKQVFYVGENCPTFAESYNYLVKFARSIAPDVELTDDDICGNLFFIGNNRFSEGYFTCTQKPEPFSRC